MSYCNIFCINKPTLIWIKKVVTMVLDFSRLPFPFLSIKGKFVFITSDNHILFNMSTGFLTRTWKWRKQKCSPKCNPERDYMFAIHCNSVSSLNNGFLKTVTNKHRKVRFDTSVNAIFISTVEEYASADWKNLLWWDQKSYLEFKKSAIEEIKNIIRKDPKLDARNAMRILYQPNADAGSMVAAG